MWLMMFDTYFVVVTRAKFVVLIAMASVKSSNTNTSNNSTSH